MDLVANNLSYKPDDQYHLNEVSFNFKEGFVGGKFDLVSYDAKGVDKIKKALLIPPAINKDTTLKIASNGSPSYRISVKAPNYKQAEEELKIAVDSVLKTLKAEGGIGSFERS